MRRLLLIPLLCCLAFGQTVLAPKTVAAPKTVVIGQPAAGGGGTAPTIVQAGACTSGGTSCTITMTTTTGHELYAAVSSYQAGVNSISGTGATFNQANVQKTQGNLGQETFLASGITGGTNVVYTCATTNGATSLSCILIELTAGSTHSVDQVAAGSGASGTSLSSGATSATTQANELALGCAVIAGAQTFTAGGSYALVTISIGSTTLQACESLALTSTGAQTATMTIGAVEDWILQLSTLN